MGQKILIIEDDRAIVNFLSISLKTNGYEFIIANDGLSGISKFFQENPALILLDLGLGDIEGTEVIRQVRMKSSIPIIVISARSTDKDKVDALDTGANDYLTKPFSITELMARIRAALRFASSDNVRDNSSKVFEGDTFRIDFEFHKVFSGQNEIHLTPIEFKILELFIHYQGRVLTHAYLQKEHSC